MRGNDYDGMLIAVEGIDGAGKSSVVEAIAEWGRDRDREVVTTAEPTDMHTGSWVYAALKDDSTPAVSDFALFVADRAQHVENRIKPALERGAIVVTDRYSDSTRAYQTHRVADETDMAYDEAREWMNEMFEPWNIQPDFTIYIDITVPTAVERCDMGDKYERYDSLVQARHSYREMYDKRPARSFVEIDGQQPLEWVKTKALHAVRREVVRRES